MFLLAEFSYWIQEILSFISFNNATVFHNKVIEIAGSKIFIKSNNPLQDYNIANISLFLGGDGQIHLSLVIG